MQLKDHENAKEHIDRSNAKALFKGCRTSELLGMRVQYYSTSNNFIKSKLFNHKNQATLFHKEFFEGDVL
jgi:hypothetical protein